MDANVDGGEVACLTCSCVALFSLWRLCRVVNGSATANATHSGFQEAASAANRAKRQSSAEDFGGDSSAPTPLGLTGRSHSRATSGSRTDVSTDHEDEAPPAGRKVGPVGVAVSAHCLRVCVFVSSLCCLRVTSSPRPIYPYP